MLSVLWFYIRRFFLIKLIIWDTFILRDSSTLGTPLVIPWKMCQNLYSDVPSEEDTSLKGTQTVTRRKYVPINAGSVALAGGTPLFTLSCAKDVPLGEIQPNGDLTAGFGCRSSNRSFSTNASFSSG